MKQYFAFLFILFYSFIFSQQTEIVDFKVASADLSINPHKKFVYGSVVYSFEVLKSVDSIFIDSRNISYKSLLLNDKKIAYYTKDDKLWLIHDFEPSKNNVLRIDYECFPKKAMYFVGWDNEAKDQIWTQGQGKYTSNWLPSFDDVNEKVEFDLNISFDKEFEVIANGRLKNKEVSEDIITWYYDMKQPMSSYLVALAIGKYDKKLEYSKSGIPLEMYFYPEDSLIVEPTYRYTKEMFDFLEKEIGLAYPWQNYKLIPVHDFLYAGMENTSTTIFSDTYMIDETAFVDKNFVNVNAHELSHQWFGDLVTAKSGEHHWLQEGFATYYALLAERKVFGEDYYYWKLFEYAQELLEQDNAGESTSLLDAKSSSATFYKKGAWALHILREQIGEKAFKIAVKRYLKKHQFKNVSTMDFLLEIQYESGQDMTNFISTWLDDKTFPKGQAYRSLENNEFAMSMIQLTKFDTNKDITKLLSKCDEILHSDSFYPLQQELFSRIKNIDSLEAIQLYKRAFRSNNIKKRQAIAQNLKDIPLVLKQDYESLLNDKSYSTIEAALFYLWNNFPQDQEIYLEKTKNITGFSDKNIRTLWLALAILTDSDSVGDLEKILEELIGYTSPDHSFEVRTNAFRYLRWIRSCDDTCMENLKVATNHHNWRFKQFAKQLMESY